MTAPRFAELILFVIGIQHNNPPTILLTIILYYFFFQSTYGNKINSGFWDAVHRLINFVEKKRIKLIQHIDILERMSE